MHRSVLSLLALTASVGLAACSPILPRPSNEGGTEVHPEAVTGSPSPATATATATATLIVRQVFVGEGFFTEGAYAYVELLDSTGRLVDQAEASEYRIEYDLAAFTVDAGEYELRSYVRPCNGSCEVLDAPTAACAGTVELPAGSNIRVRIERTLRSCIVKLA